MKIYSLLILTAVLLAFFTGRYALVLKSPSSFTPDERAEIPVIFQQFRRKVFPVMVIDFDMIYYSEELGALIQPTTILPSIAKNNSSHKKAAIGPSSPSLPAPTSATSPSSSSFSMATGSKTNRDIARDCFDKNLLKSLDIYNYEKLVVWEEYRCGIRDNFPKGYFSFPPYMHPSGVSFAKLAFQSRNKYYNSQNWALAHLAYFHLGEFAEVNKKIGPLFGIFKIFAKFTPFKITQLNNGHDNIVLGDYILMRAPVMFQPTRAKYEVYAFHSLVDFIENTQYSISEYKPNKECLLATSNLCWNYNRNHLFEIISKSSLVVFVVSLFIIGLVIWQLLSKIRLQRREEEQKRLALQILTHEFRTPIASMLVQMENIKVHMGKLDDDMLEAFLRISNDVYRLQRLTEKSRSYLRSQNGIKVFEFTPALIPSINEFVKNHYNNYLDQVGIEYLSQDADISMKIDSYWLSICMQNLVENMLAHGKACFKIILKKSVDGKYLRMSFEDEGECEFKTIKEMIRPFLKGTQSKGTGLGLNIVYRVIREMGGDLLFEKNPKRFTLVIPIATK
jgi:hypothetical protein